MTLNLTPMVWSVHRYVEHTVHVSDLQRAIWAEDRHNWSTSALDAKKQKKLQPTS